MFIVYSIERGIDELGRLLNYIWPRRGVATSKGCANSRTPELQQTWTHLWVSAICFWRLLSGAYMKKFNFVLHLASLRIQPFLRAPRRENGCIRKLGVVSHIGMSIIHRCRHEISEQDSSEEIFHLIAVFGRKVPHLRISSTDSKFRHISCTQLIKKKTAPQQSPAKKLSLAGLKCNPAFHFKQFR